MSVPRLVYRVVVVGGSILGKAFYEAGRQVIANTQASGSPAAAAAAPHGVYGTGADAITRRHRMTLDEACQILNVKNERLTDDTTLTNMLKNYDHLFKSNANTSHFLLSKIVRAKDRIEAEIPFGAHSSDTQPPPSSGSPAPPSGSPPP